MYISFILLWHVLRLTVISRNQCVILQYEVNVGSLICIGPIFFSGFIHFFLKVSMTSKDSYSHMERIEEAACFLWWGVNISHLHRILFLGKTRCILYVITTDTVDMFPLLRDTIICGLFSHQTEPERCNKVPLQARLRDYCFQNSHRGLPSAAILTGESVLHFCVNSQWLRSYPQQAEILAEGFMSHVIAGVPMVPWERAKLYLWIWMDIFRSFIRLAP